MNDDRYSNASEFPIPSDEDLRHWLAWNYKCLNDPRHQDEQAQSLLKRQIVIVEELLHYRAARTVRGGATNG